MEDILKYRIPNEDPVQKNGVFRKSPALDLSEAFVVSTFEKRDTYFFVEDEAASSELHFSGIEPVCYSQSSYLSTATQFVNDIRNRKLSKAIVSRIEKVHIERDVFDVFDGLCTHYQDAFVYLISSDEFGTWIGATPEILMSSRSGIGKTAALAGTRRISDEKEWGQKEKDEQQYVTDFITEQLQLKDVKDLKVVGPHEFLAGPVKHLESTFRFSMNDQNALDLALNLHPTPAVSRLPRKEAIELIHSFKTHDRSLYTGFLGKLGTYSDLFVNLRCAQVIGNDWYLYVGGGFTKDSIPMDEWEETENKARTLLDVLENL